MNNYSYITMLSDDSYIFGIILLQKSLKDVDSKYPLEVLVTSNVSKPILHILRQLNIKHRIIDPIRVDRFIEYNSKINAVFAKNWYLTLSKLEIFKLVEYNKIVFLDTDIMLLKNIDHLFECEHMTAALDGEYFNIWPNNPHFNAGCLVIEPNKEEYDKIIDFTMKFDTSKAQQNGCIADQEILNEYFSDWVEKENLHLNKYYNIFAPYVEEEYLEDVRENAYFIHFIGRKPWRAFNKPSHETYSEFFYQESHKIIQEVVNGLDWNAAKKKIKVAIYGICKDEMPNVEKYVKCFKKADYLCILDTGSTDGTWEYLQTARKRYPNLIVDQKIIDPWRYDKARNLSLELVPKDTTIYFMMDLDEIIKEDDWVQKIKDAWDPLFSRGVYTYNRQVDKVTDAVVQQFEEYRIHSNIWHYKGIVHEQLCDMTGSRAFFADECIRVPIIVWHYPTNPNREAYIELCERGVDEEPWNWLMHLQLAAEYEVHLKYDKAIGEYRKILAEQNGLSIPEIGRCYASLGRALSLVDKEDEGLDVLRKGMKEVPDYGDCYFFAAEIYYRKGKFKESVEVCENGLKNCTTSYWCTIVNRNSYFPYYLLGLGNYYLNNKVLALGYLAIAKEKNNNEETNSVFNLILNEIK